MEGKSCLRRQQDSDKTFKAGRGIGRGGQQHRYLYFKNINNRGEQRIDVRHHEYKQKSGQNRQEKAKAIKKYQHQTRRFMTRLNTFSVSIASANYQITRLECGANDHFIWDCKVRDTCKSLGKGFVNTFAGQEPSLGKITIIFNCGHQNISWHTSIAQT